MTRFNLSDRKIFGGITLPEHRDELRSLRQQAEAASAKAAVAVATYYQLMEVGQKVSIKDDAVHKPEQLGVNFTVERVRGSGGDAFASLRAPDGSVAEWFRVDALRPALINNDAPITSGRIGKPFRRDAGTTAKRQDERPHLLQLADRAECYAKDRNVSFRDAVSLADGVAGRQPVRSPSQHPGQPCPEPGHLDRPPGITLGYMHGASSSGDPGPGDSKFPHREAGMAHGDGVVGVVPHLQGDARRAGGSEDPIAP